MGYSCRMTELNPLEYTIAAIVLIPAVCLLVAYADGDLRGFCQYAWPLAGIPLQTLMWIIGKVMGLGAWMARPCFWWVFSLGDLWFAPLATRALTWRRRLDHYRYLRSYQGVYRAARA